jgi:hypothetical protein
MAVSDSPDFQKTVQVNTVAEADNPDWQETVTAPGGAPIGGTYASLTGAGQTETPGALTQEGDFTIGGDLVVYADSQVLIKASEHGFIQLANLGTGGIQVYDEGGGGIRIVTADGGLVVSNGDPTITFAGVLIGDTTGNGVQIGYADTDLLGFFDTPPVAQQPTPTTLAEVIALLRAYGLSA